MPPNRNFYPPAAFPYYSSDKVSCFMLSEIEITIWKVGMTRSRLSSIGVLLLIVPQAALAGILTTQVIFLVLRSHKSIIQTSASLTADTLTIVGIGGVGWLSYIGHQRSLRPSTLLSLYLSALVILDIPRVRTLWLIGRVNGEATLMTATLIFTAVALLLESTEKRSSVVEEKRFGAPEEYSGFWTRTAFAWLTATFRVGYSKILVQDDLPILDTQLQGNLLHQNLVRTWAKCKSFITA
jgi:ATP-binding cassette subfamily C (CFTR/MRP) protein 1